MNGDFDGANQLGVYGRPQEQMPAFSGAGFTNLGGPEMAEAGNTFVFLFDLRGWRQIKLVAYLAAAGNTGLGFLKYSYADYNTVGSYSRLTQNAIPLSGALGIRETDWEDLPAGSSNGPLFIRAFASGGDGLEDPLLQFGIIMLRK